MPRELGLWIDTMHDVKHRYTHLVHDKRRMPARHICQEDGRRLRRLDASPPPRPCNRAPSLFIQKFLMSYCGLKVLEQLRYELFAKIICLPVDFFGETRVSMLMSRIINDVNLISSSLPEVIRITQNSLTMIGLVALVIYRDAQLAFWVCLVFPLTVLPPTASHNF